MLPENFTNIARPEVLSRKNFNKIFCIGGNKTGTTTLETVLTLYGYKLPNQQEQEIRLTEQTFNTNYSEFASFVSAFDAFQDMPFSQGLTFVVADALFPNSKFILSERDSESWFRSLSTFHKNIFNIDDLSSLSEEDVYEKFDYLYKGYSYADIVRQLTIVSGDKVLLDWKKLYDKDYYISMYEQRNNAIKKYFMNAKNKLLVIDITKEKNTEKLCRFLNIPEKFIIEMPKVNATE